MSVDIVAPWCTISNMKKPKKVNYHGSLSEYKESMLAGPPVEPDNTTMDSDGYSVLPTPQFIGNMPAQLAAYDDDVNRAGEIAKGAPTYAFNRASKDLGLRFRGVNEVFVNPQFVNEKNYFRNDADSAYRQAAIKSTNDNTITDHENINTMYGGVVEGAAALSKYFNKPFNVLSEGIEDVEFQTPVHKKDLLVNIGGTTKNPAAGGSAYPYMFRPNDYGNTTGMNLVEQNLNVRANDYVNKEFVNEPGYEYSSQPTKTGWAKTFMHEFGHNLGGAHAALSPGVPSVKGGSTKNSIMSYQDYSPAAKLLPADINRLRDVMGYNQTPQGIKQAVDRFERTGEISSKPKVENEDGNQVVFSAPIKVKKNKKDNKK